MKNKFFGMITVILVSCSPQKQLPVLMSNSPTVSIQEGNVLYPDSWKASPEVMWDEYVTKKFGLNSQVSFYSDIDTISFDVEPNRKYDFVVQFDKKKAYTRLNTDTALEASIAPMKTLSYKHGRKKTTDQNDTIPFTIGDDNRIHIKGKINDSDTLDFVFDTGANALAITSSLVGKKVIMKMDGETLNSGSDGSSIKQTSSGNRLEVKDMIWDSVTFTSIDYQGYSFDGVIGWIAFGGKTVEIDYEEKIMVIHASLKDIPLGYSKVSTAMIQGVPYINGIITVGNKEHRGWFEFDTGAKRSFYLSQQYVRKNKLNYKDMELIGTSVSSGSTGVRFDRKIFKLPKLEFGEFQTYQIPIGIAEKDPENVEFNDLLGNDLLKRFNAIIDLSTYQIYLRPNDLLHSAYQQ